MRDDELLGLLRERAGVAEALAGLGFDIAHAEAPEPLRLRDGGPLEPLAGDGAGGVFLLAGPVGDFRPVVHAGADGAGGLVAGGVREALALVVGLPGLREALAEPPGPHLRERLTGTDEALRARHPDLERTRERLRSELDLPPADSLLGALHAAAADEGYRPVGAAGPYRSPVPAGPAA